MFGFGLRRTKRALAECQNQLANCKISLQDCRGELEDCKVERGQARFDMNQANEALHESMAQTAALREKLSATEVRLSNAQAETSTYFTAHKTARAEADDYRTDNVTLIARVGKLQEEVSFGREQFSELNNRNLALENTVGNLLEAVEKARAKKTKAKKKKSSKKKRK
jgi:chromosome segregation ATPase